MKVSVLVPVRRAETTLRTTVDSLRAACHDVEHEIVVAFSEADPTASIAQKLQGVKLVSRTELASVPQLRRDALRASTGEFVAITEDHCTFPHGWLETLIAAADAHPASAWGGPVANGRTSWLGWAHFFTRYTAFLPPGRAAYTAHLPGNNALYRRQDLLGIATEWADGFWEAELNAVLARESGPFWFAPQACITQHQQRGLFEYASLRYRHGRCYGARCGKPHSVPVLFVATLLFWRGLRAAARAGELPRFLVLSPLLGVYYSCWALGEAAGYLFGPGNSCGNTD